MINERAKDAVREWLYGPLPERAEAALGRVLYEDFVRSKRLLVKPSGFDADAATFPSDLFDYQRDITRWALRLGKAAIFAGTGLGKTVMQLTWAEAVAKQTGQPVLILAPLAVAQQTANTEAPKFGFHDALCASQSDVKPGVNITNYDKLHRFDPSVFAGIVLDESSILKSFDGSTRTALIEAFISTPYKLACTATPAPNDFMELGNHAEFLGVMKRTEMLAMFFVHDGGETQKWRLKGHAEDDFWKWMASWSVMFESPTDLGYDGSRFVLPPLQMHEIIVDSQVVPEGMLFATEAQTLLERRRARKNSVDDRVQEVAMRANASDEPWLIWCDLNTEGDLLAKAIPGSVQVAGSDGNDAKESRMLGFTTGAHRVLISKPTICGFGMNWQHCPNVAFVGVSDSYEQFFQALRRCWRFGQAKSVNCYIVASTAEGAVLSNIKRKEADAQKMRLGMIAHMRVDSEAALHSTERMTDAYQESTEAGETWTVQLGDCIDAMATIADGSLDYSIFSPPFASLYTYSNSPRDMGNCKTHGEFYEHFRFLVRELYRTLKPGRLLSFHCMNLPTSKVRDGVIGISDFRGELIRLFVDEGWIYHSEVVIWKDPVTAMQRTKAIGLLYKQLKKDSCISRQGIPDYLVTMRKPGENLEPVTKKPEDFPVTLWQNYASPVWMDINASDTLQKDSARDERDERHIAPLQLEVIRRAIRLWTNPQDVVFSPFAGIGSEGYVALELGRRFIGVELKDSYFRQAVANLRGQEQRIKNGTLFGTY
jgi:hypothetical protein